MYPPPLFPKKSVEQPHIRPQGDIEDLVLDESAASASSSASASASASAGAPATSVPPASAAAAKPE